MLLRLVVGAGIFALGYYVGREVGRMEPIIEELAKAHDGKRVPHAGTYDHEETADMHASTRES